MTLRRTKLNNIHLKKLTGEEVWQNSTLGLLSFTKDSGNTWTTIADKDLGASGVGLEGNLYQWGNDYGFPATGTVTRSTTTVNVDNYGPGNHYDTSTWTRATYGYIYTTTYSSSQSTYGKDLWGGTTNTVIARQGPCPEGWHIPSNSEFSALLTCAGTLPSVVCLMLHLPYAGSLLYDDATTSNQGITVRYWTSDGYQSGKAYALTGNITGGTFTSENPLAVGYNTNLASGFSIRPFYNTGVAPDSGWNQILYDGDKQIWHSTSMGMISFTNDGGTTWTTMSDKNLGATELWNNGDTMTQANCGYYYQRGNNYGFPFDGQNISTTTALVSAGGYGPGNYYSSSNFVTTSANPATWLANPILNLRGGLGTTEDRRGPCPEGFHIPTRTEWNNNIPSMYGHLDFVTSGHLRSQSSGKSTSASGSTLGWWTCEASGTTNAHRVGITTTLGTTSNMYYQLYIRPFKDVPVVPSAETGWIRTYQGSVTKTITGVYKGTEKIWPESNLLRFIADEAGSTIQLKTDYDTVNTLTLETSTDGTTWTSYTVEPNAAGAVITLDNVGDTVYFRNANNSNGFSTGSGAYYQFVMTGSIYAKGDINYLYSKISTDTVDSYAYYKLFDGCTALKSAPDLPAVCLGTYCYAYMFHGCTGLTETPYLPATALESYCYQYMFGDCTSLTTIYDLPATGLATFCCQRMFSGCTALTTAPSLPATTLANYCYNSMFSGCTSLVNAPTLPATTLATYCYQRMFDGCTALTTAPNLPATTLASSCYNNMFSGCTSLVNAPALPATTLATYCCQRMFYGCTSLVNAPALPATTLANSCYHSMFYGCTSLVNAPALPATTLATYCYADMFDGCTALTTAPNLPATTLASSCYNSMFYGCTSLVNAPALPATTLATYCYHSMFYGCTSLTTASALPATMLPNYCYYYMFNGCSNLTTLPALYVTSFASTQNYQRISTIQYMFQNCSKIKLSTTQTDEYVNEYRIPIIGAISASVTGTYMFQGTGGTFTGSPTLGTTYYTSNTVAYQN